MSVPLHPTAAHVADTLIARGHPGVVQAQAESVRTAAQAAAALRVEAGAIVRSVVLLLDDDPVLMLVSGAHEVNEEATGKRLEGVLAPAPPEMVRLATGQPEDGIAPVGHPTDLPTYLDESLADHPVLWACAGHPRTVFRTTFPELLRITAGLAIDIT
ncbi:YbaK/EbsC family protein [Rhodococcus sp. D2-41]|uniref:YbaK/EbsC family protein n=1 Tax=Speluncibacter jeojiensis TaxID=2710754 RepID=A0A9X4M7W3_9ACTN|nr:YbaK/EbsC family protein [Rhodococcus sp. D2-41]MDG3009320.1 YbaK/EbsC family protein [Rhodococcus sp. D2-41]MDG3016893.1 YbaK/EbsC family protein [Corynebacteriales bacterium D3-21]